MKYSVIILTVISYMSSAQDFTLFQNKLFIHENDTLPYRILYPENYDASKKYPLLLFLHGGGERGKDNEKQLMHGTKIFLESVNRTRYPVIVIVPQCPENSYWASAKIERTQYPLDIRFNYKNEIPKPLQLAIDLTHHMMKQERVDSKRVYITGLSMGGMGTLEAVYRFPDLFAAAAVVCGGGDTQSYSPKQTKTSIWLFHGDKDNVVDVHLSREMYEHLKKLKADVKYTEYAGVNHNSWDNAYAEPQLLEWMFSKRKR